MAGDYGEDNLGESPPHFDFSTIDYLVKSALKTGLRRCMEAQ